MTREITEEKVIGMGASRGIPGHYLENAVRPAVILTAESSAAFCEGDEVRLIRSGSEYALKDASGKMIRAEISANLPASKAEGLLLSEARFRIRRVRGSVMQAEGILPYVLTSRGSTEWTYLN
ncbi:MAG: hypothetical protein K6A40_01265 [Solobacterium sp.]|nr:hypothetical protein [Solobacterium sp.]